MEPIVWNPDIKEHLWGGTKLNTVYGKDLPSDHCGESWEVACRANGQSKAANGPYKHMIMEDILLKHGKEVIGKAYHKGDKFPLLLKLIDAKRDLSVQVHPDDAYAKVHENGELGKTEAWVILEADKGSRLIVGLKDGTTKEDFKKALSHQDLESVLNKVSVKPGDVIDIPAGLIHAIGKGIMLAEIQQNSDTTYRVYDWNRLGLDGKGRELHIEKAMEVIDFEGKNTNKLTEGDCHKNEGFEIINYISNHYFALERINVVSSYKDERKGAFELFTVIEGFGVLSGLFKDITLKKGDTVMIPYALKAYNFAGQLSMLKTYVPK